MVDRTLRRLASEESGYTLIELLIVIVILSILLLIAVPAYLQYQDNAYQTAATGNLRDVATAAAVYDQENATFAGMTVVRLKLVDAGLAPGTYVNNSGVEAAGVTARQPLDSLHFCVYAQAGRWFAYELNPTGAITTTTIPSAVCT